MTLTPSSRGAVHELAQMTWTEVRDLPPSACVALLPIGAVEAHGPHLPVNTDVIIAQGMAHAAAEQLARRGQSCVLLESLRYTAAPFARAFPGTVSIQPSTMRALLTDLIQAILGQGFAQIILCNAHLDPAHIAVLREVTARVSEPHRVLFPDVTRRHNAQRLSGEFQSGACHAGQYESSLVLARAPALVRQDRMRTLADNPHSLIDAIAQGKDDFVQSGGPEAYFGYPSRATADEGRETYVQLGQIVVDAWAQAREGVVR